MIYFIYNLNRTNLGGFHPEINIENTFNFNLFTYGEWRVGNVEIPDELYLISEFNPIIISEEEAFGIQFIGKTKKYSFSIKSPDLIEEDLTPTELKQKALAEKLIKKLTVRKEIETQVGDTEDLIADLSKRIDLCEFVIYSLLINKFSKQNLPESFHTLYDEINTYLTDITNKTQKNYLSKVSFGEILSKIKQRNTNVINILEEKEYL